MKERIFPARIVTISEYCERSRWGLTPKRVRDICRDGFNGNTPPFKRMGTRYYIDIEKFDNWLDVIGDVDEKRHIRERRFHMSDSISEILRREDALTRKSRICD